MCDGHVVRDVYDRVTDRSQVGELDESRYSHVGFADVHPEVLRHVFSEFEHEAANPDIPDRVVAPLPVLRQVRDHGRHQRRWNRRDDRVRWYELCRSLDTSQSLVMHRDALHWTTRNDAAAAPLNRFAERIHECLASTLDVAQLFLEQRSP